MESAVVDGASRLIEIPSVAGAPEAAHAAVKLIAEMCADAGLSVEQWSSNGAPALFAQIPAPPGAPTVLFYGHYDVQPPDPLDAWESPPFLPSVRDGALFGRGAGDNKGQFVAHIYALRALAEAGGCPVGVKLLIEGEEEIGSPNLPALIAERREQLGCDVAITADGPYHPDGHPLIIFGVRGLLYVEASAQGASRDLHSGSNGGIAPVPARRLARALARLWDADGRVALPGFYDQVLPPSAAELAHASALPLVRGAADGDDGPDRHARVMFAPNLNIAGIWSGYTGPGMKTVIPHRADAKIDVRLVADQDPDDIYRGLRAFLGEHEISVTRLAAVPPSRTPVENPYTEPVRRAIEAAWERPAFIQPRLGGTTPDFVFTRMLGIPSLLVPYAPNDMHHHAPNERMELSALFRGVRTSASICLELAERNA